MGLKIDINKGIPILKEKINIKHVYLPIRGTDGSVI
jgi:hypothetical protein